MNEVNDAIGEPAETQTCVRSPAEWAAQKGTPRWALAAAQTVARIQGRPFEAVTEDEFQAAIEGVL